MDTKNKLNCYQNMAEGYASAHERWLRYAGGEAQCAFEGAVAALLKLGFKMLDAACGTGSFVRRVLENVDDEIEVMLLDSSSNMLARCQDIFATRFVGCLSKLPFEDGKFDLVTCAWGIEVVQDPKNALSELIRTTRPGGKVCLVFCADRPARNLFASAMRKHITLSKRGNFLNHENIRQFALENGASRVQILHNSGPAAAMIIHVSDKI